MHKRIFSLVMFFVLLATTGVFAADTYTIDPAHTSFGFTVKHMMISNVAGGFDKFEGQVTFDPKDLAASKASVTIDTASINTRMDKRDEHLKSPDFFDAAQFPTITFESTKFSANEITGNLTIKGVTKEVTIPVTVAGPVKTMMGTNAIGITGSVTINRQDFGVNWNKTLDQGGVAVSDDVVITISIEAEQK